MRNPFEQRIAAQLRRAKVPYEYERTRLPFTIRGFYIPDYTLGGESPIYIECKGFLRPETKRKMVGVRRDNPTADIRFIFQSRENTKQGRAYAKWAKKSGFRYAFESIPKEWLI